MADLFDINLAAATTREFLRQGGRLAEVPRLWWYRWRGVIWLVEQGFPVAPTLRLCESQEISSEVVEELRAVRSDVEADFGPIQFVRAVELPLDTALAALSVSRDGSCVSQVTRVARSAVTAISISFTSRLQDGTICVTGNSRNYWDPPRSLKTQHVRSRSPRDVFQVHQSWLRRQPASKIVSFPADGGLSIMQHLSQVLTQAYIARGLYRVRERDVS